MKRKEGFTLIELLIVTVVIVTLMGIVFRLAGIGSGVRAKNKTISRIQRLENALSGYYAAFGSYPPVPLHGLQDMNLKCDDMGLLLPGTSGSGNWSSTSGKDEMQRQIRAVCFAQPVAACYPYADTAENRDYLNSLSSDIKDMCSDSANYPGWAARAAAFSSGFSGLDRNIFGNSLHDTSDWQDIRVFKFGLLSFLLPRYLFMLEGKREFYDDCRQWEANNRKIVNFVTGVRIDSWETVQRAIGAGEGNSGGNDAGLASMITNLPTQAVCARWMPNFKNMISGGKTFYGVDTDDGYAYNSVNDPDTFMIYSPYSNGSSGNAYVLDGMTIRDGWDRDLYYHSAPPYQSYVVWSAGPDGKTFPPWIDLDSLESEEARKVAADWMKDDIIHLSN